ncbi:hypothetical protein DV738_g3700, partial [Chaetothyriales sp. CBS 135597]
MALMANSQPPSPLRLSSASASASTLSLVSGRTTSPDCLPRSQKHSFQNIRTPRYVGDHYPLIRTISPHLIPAHVAKDHSAIFCARSMAQMHNTVIRAINSSYNHALAVRFEDADDFLFFNKQLCAMIRHHQTTTDTYLFPAIEKLLLSKTGGDMNISSKIAEHERFMHSFKLFEAYVQRTKPAEYVGRTFRHLIESFAPRLIQHLHDEIPVLTSAWVLDSGELMKAWKKSHEKASRRAGSQVQACWVLGCQDRSFQVDGRACEFPNVTGLVHWLVGRLYGKKHERAWRWCPSDLQGRRRLLPPEFACIAR